MKKKVVKVISRIFLIVIVGMMLLNGLDGVAADLDGEEIAPLAPEVEENICNDYLQMLKEKKPDDSVIQNLEPADIIIEYYGTYSGCEVVLMYVKDMPDTDDVQEICIGKYVFEFGSGSASRRFYVHKGHEFIPVKNAYKENLLTSEDIELLAKIFGYAYELRCDYEDVSENDWFHDAAAYNYYEKTMTGKDATHFAPAETLARAQLAAVLYKMNKQPEVAYTAMFSDVTEKDWFANAVLWLANKRVVTGYTETDLFGPNDNVTREQMVAMMYRYAKDYREYDVNVVGDYDSFPDAENVQGFARNAMKWAVSNGIITGKTVDGALILDPQRSVIRAECAAIVQRFMEKYEE